MTVYKKLAFHIVAIAVLIMLVFFVFNACPIRAITGVPCPTCGITRSTLALLRLDFQESFYYHPLTIPIYFVLWFAIHKDLFNINKKTKNIILIVFAVIIFIVYLFRLFMNKIC